jgi:5,10-methylenetetrahydromethanopterin reductase
MKFGIGILPESLELTAHKAGVAERAGFDRIYTGDMQSTHRELHITLATMGAATSKVQVGSGMTNPVSRDLAVTAGAFATLAELTEGRAFIGMGVGDSALRNIGLKAATLKELESAVLTLRRLFADGTAIHQDRTLRLTWWKGAPIPIYLSAHGPKSLEMAGRVADGVIVGYGLTQTAVTRALAHIAEGAQSASRNIEDLDIWFLAHTNIGDDDLKASRDIANTLAVSGHLLAKSALPTIPEKHHEALGDLVTRYDYGEHAKAVGSGNSLLIEELGLLDYFAERFGVVGTSRTCLNRVRELERYGVRNLWMSRAAPDFDSFVEEWSREVIVADGS